MIKKIFIILILAAVIAGCAAYFYRHAIIKHYTEKIIRENLPPYIKIESVNFDFTNSRISLKNFIISNPPEFPSQFLIKINEISCRYGILGKWIPNGLEISDVFLSGADIRIERLRNGRVNAAEMEKFIQSFPPKEVHVPDNAYPKGPSAAQTLKEATGLINKKLSDLIKLPTSFEVKKSKFAFLDNVPYDSPYITTIESVSGQISLNFGYDYSKITGLSFTLMGRLNGQDKELIQWVGSLDPAAPKLTMSNRFDVSGLNIMTFGPYYDRFSPFVFKRGRFSGTLIFDFNNGNIGSTNEVHLSNLTFYVKPGYENAQMWETNVPDLMRYFTTTSGEVVFDFKIKGDMANPQFYLGPISKRAITSAVIDKVASYAMDQITKQKEGAGGGADSTKQALDMLKGFLNKK